MPLLARLGLRAGPSPATSFGAQPDTGDYFHPGLIGECANPDCRSGWLHLFRKRTTPVFEGGWTCSPECTEARVLASLRREVDGTTVARQVHRHRIPLGLLMLENGWISREQLRKALEAQRAAGTGRIGEWLIQQEATDEDTVTRALGLQWSCPVLSVSSYDPAAFTAVMPRLFLDAFGVLPLRMAAGKLLYLGFEEVLDPALALAVGRITGLRVESGVLPSAEFRAAQPFILKEKFPTVQLAEAVSESAAARLLARSIERSQPIGARLVRVHNCIWMRMTLLRGRSPIPRIDAVSDVVCSIGKL